MENWKAIAGYEGYYEVSNLGNVRSIPHEVCTKGGVKRMSPGRNLIQKKARNGYMRVHLSKEGEARYHAVHRLVATAFVFNPDNLKQVNHKDENKANNQAENLEWCTRSYNCKYGHRNDTMIERRRHEVQSIIGNVIQTYYSIQSASRITGVNAAHICQCCKGERDTAGGMKWRYAK